MMSRKYIIMMEATYRTCSANLFLVWLPVEAVLIGTKHGFLEEIGNTEVRYIIL